MVNKAYMVGAKPPPRSAKRVLDQVITPAAIDAAAQGEAVLERISQATKAWPWTSLAGALFLGWIAGGPATGAAKRLRLRR